MVYIAQQSFGFGETDPGLRAQYESMPYQRGCQTLTNALLSDTGSAIKRWGSTEFRDNCGNHKAHEFYDGFGTRFLVVDQEPAVGYLGYAIIQGTTTIATYQSVTTYASSNAYVKDVASSGNEVFILTMDGLYKHTVNKEFQTTRRSLVNVDSDLVYSTPPVTFTIVAGSTGLPTIGAGNVGWKVTASSDWFEPTDVGDLYKLAEKRDEASNTTSPAWGIIVNVKSATEAWFHTCESVHLDDTSAVLTGGQFKIKNHRLTEGRRCRFVRGFVSSTYYTNEPSDLGHAWIKVIDNDTVELYSNSGLTTQFATTGANGQDPSTYLLMADEDTGSYPTFDGVPVDTVTLDWVGPYRHWAPLGAAGYSTFDYAEVGGTGIGQPPGIYADTGWSNWAEGATLKWNSGSPASEYWGTNTDNNEQKILTQGMVVKAVHYAPASDGGGGDGVIDIGNSRYAPRVLSASYFVVNSKPFMGNDTAINNATPTLTHIAGPEIEARSTTGTTQADAEYLVWYVATSEDQGVFSGASFSDQGVGSLTETTMHDGRPASKKGWMPSLLSRIEDRNPDGASSGTTYPVAMVGNPDRTQSYTVYPLHWVSTGVVFYTEDEYTATARVSTLVGEIAPPSTSQVFRIGKFEFDSTDNKFSYNTTTTKGPGPSAYWKITGEAFSPQKSPNSTYSNTRQAEPSILEHHQGRLFIANMTADLGYGTDLGGIQSLPSSQNLGMTIIASKTDSLDSFATGAALDSDGLSFQVASKVGGQIRWLHSQFNQLFVGATDEEFVIEDVPVTPTSVNISKQSNYGSRADACAGLFNGDIVYVGKQGKSIRSIKYNERARRYESEDLLQFAKHITANDRIKRIVIVGTATPVLFALTDSGALYSYTRKEDNNVLGWSKWENSDYTINDILSTVDGSGNDALYARTSFSSKAVLLTSDPDRKDLLIDVATEQTNASLLSTTGAWIGLTGQDVEWVGKTVSAVVTYQTNFPTTPATYATVYFGDFPVVNVSGSAAISWSSTVGTLAAKPTKVVFGLPYTFTLAPNVPEFMVPGKGSTLGRDKNVSRLRILFNKARGAAAAGFDVFKVPTLEAEEAPVVDSPGFYSVPVVGSYGPQPTINITQSAPYEFEVGGYSAEYDIGD